MNSENLLKFFVLSVRQYQMGAGYLKANFKYVKTFASKRQSVFKKGLDVFQILRGELFFCRRVSKFRREVSIP